MAVFAMSLEFPVKQATSFLIDTKTSAFRGLRIDCPLSIANKIPLQVEKIIFDIKQDLPVWTKTAREKYSLIFLNNL